MKRNPITDPRVGDRVRAVWKNPMFHKGDGVTQTAEAICGRLIATSSTGDAEIVWRTLSEWCKVDTWIERWEVVDAVPDEERES